MERIKLAIISDLHCHPEDSNCTYLKTDLLRSPSKNHPVESLLEIIDQEKLESDLTLCPGDFTDKANVQGLISGWGFSLEIGSKLKSKEIIATVGNHDVDVYAKNSNYSLKTVRGIKRNFPFKNTTATNEFWANGYTFLEESNYRILVINSSHFHYNRESAANGEISLGALENIEAYLKMKNDDKVCLAMSHHPPISHPNKQLGEDDKIVNGAELLNVLGKYKFDLFIYGHKHDPFIKYDSTSNIPLFSAGSFSAGTNIMFSGSRNAFHIIEIIKEKGISKGKIDTWTFLPHKGWEKNFDRSAFAPNTGFGSPLKPKEIVDIIKSKFSTCKSIKWEDLIKQVEDIQYLLPNESEELTKILKQNNWLFDKHIWEGPKTIYNLG